MTKKDISSNEMNAIHYVSAIIGYAWAMADEIMESKHTIGNEYSLALTEFEKLLGRLNLSEEQTKILLDSTEEMKMFTKNKK